MTGDKKPWKLGICYRPDVCYLSPYKRSTKVDALKSHSSNNHHRVYNVPVGADTLSSGQSDSMSEVSSSSSANDLGATLPQAVSNRYNKDYKQGSDSEDSSSEESNTAAATASTASNNNSNPENINGRKLSSLMLTPFCFSIQIPSIAEQAGMIDCQPKLAPENSIETPIKERKLILFFD